MAHRDAQLIARLKLHLYTLQLESSMVRSTVLASIVLLLICAACSPGKDDSKLPATERDRDSVLGASRLPGATGVRGALRAQDSAAARNSRLDSVANQP
jgi:hypothetical protein